MSDRTGFGKLFRSRREDPIQITGFTKDRLTVLEYEYTYIRIFDQCDRGFTGFGRPVEALPPASSR
jgi:hypothetical protein